MATEQPASTATVEQVVRTQLSQALGGKRGMLEAAVPTVVFTVLFLTMHNLRNAIVASLAVAVVLLLIRIVQRSSVQFVINAIFGIGIGAAFAWRAGRGGGDANDQALAYFLPGILYNAAYAVVMGLSVAVRWPIMGFMVGSVAGDPVAWRKDRQVVRLCSLLTLCLLAPCVIRVLIQTPMYLAGTQGWWEPSAAIAALGTAKLALGWPLQIAAILSMVWVLGRDHTPIEPGQPEPHI